MKLVTITNVLNIQTNSWISLPKVSIITTCRNGNIYINNNCIFYFDSSKKLLYISEDAKYPTLDSLSSDKDAYPIKNAIDLDVITGFVSSYTVGPYGIYAKKTN